MSAGNEIVLSWELKVSRIDFINIRLPRLSDVLVTSSANAEAFCLGMYNWNQGLLRAYGTFCVGLAGLLRISIPYLWESQPLVIGITSHEA
jgi:hypothetical protein